MTYKEFNNTRFSKKMKVMYDGDTYSIGQVDFEIGVLKIFNNKTFWYVKYQEITIVKEENK